MRSALAYLLLVVAGLVLAVASLGVWVERVVFDEDAFIASVDGILDEPAVQRALAEALADEILAEFDIEEVANDIIVRTEEELGGEFPAALGLLTPPLAGSARGLLIDELLRALASRPIEERFETALRELHGSVLAILRDADVAAGAGSGRVVIDLGPVLEALILEIGGARGDELLERLDLAEDAALLSLGGESDAPAAWWLARRFDDLVLLALAAPLVAFLLAFLLSPNRRRMVVAIGVTFITSSVLLLVFADPILEGVATGWVDEPVNRAAAEAIYGHVLRSFELQSTLLLAAGGLLVVAGIVSERRPRPGALRASGAAASRVGPRDGGRPFARPGSALRRPSSSPGPSPRRASLPRWCCCPPATSACSSC